ncbi:MAG: acetyl-CoA carboxylase biotin carboxyl carrier protein [Lachnospiraceae bacterium]
MNEIDIRKYAGLMQELGLTGLEITEDNKMVRLERTTPVAAVQQTIPVEQDFSQDTMTKADSRDYVSVTSPLVGMFYAAPAENADPYVSVGDRVTKGQTLCIVEAMKMMNEITAEEDGLIAEICVTNGHVVEYGTELFRIKR